MLKVTTYSDVRLFLKDSLRVLKAAYPDWTATLWAQRLGLESTTALTMIFNGQRNVGQTIEDALIKFFAFSEKDKRHFQLLIKKSKLTETDPLLEILNAEIELNIQSKSVIDLTEAELAIINQWYFFALRQLARLRPIPKDQKYLQQILNCDDTIDLCHAVDILVKQEYLIQVDTMYVANDITLATTQNIPSESIKNIHEQFGTLAVEAVRKYDVQMRNFQSCNFKFNRHNLDKAHHLIEKFVADFETLFDKNDGDSVYHMNVQLFPLAVLNETSAIRN